MVAATGGASAGRKKRVRKKLPPRLILVSSWAMSSAETIRTGTMKTTNHKVFRSAFQEFGSSNRNTDSSAARPTPAGRAGRTG